MIWRIVERVHADLPAVPVWNAETDISIGHKERSRRFQKSLRVFLMFEDFKKRDDVVSADVIQPKIVLGELGGNIHEPVVILGELNCVAVLFDTGYFKSTIASCGKKISSSTTNIQQAALLRRALIIQKKEMSRFERHGRAIATLVGRFIPFRPWRFDRIPKMKVATRTGKKTRI